MDQTFFVFIILFAIIIIYLFKQKNDHEEMKEQLNQYVAEEHFQNQVNNAEYKDDITEYDLTKIHRLQKIIMLSISTQNQ